MNSQNNIQTPVVKDPVTHPENPDTPHPTEPEGAPSPPPTDPNPYPVDDPLPGSDPNTGPVPIDDPANAFPDGVPNVGF